MAIEIAFAVKGKVTKQALFIQESDWERPLTEIRSVIEQQELYAPLQFRFMSLSWNAISEPCEQNLVLKDVTRNHTTVATEKRHDEGTLDLGTKLEKEEDSLIEKPKDPNPAIPEVWVTPLKVFFNESRHEADDQETDQDRSHSQQSQSDSQSQQTGEPAHFCFCPYKMFAEKMRTQGGPATLLKILFGLLLILFAVLASLTLTMHMAVKAFTSTNPALHDLFSKMNMGGLGGSSAETKANFESRFSQLELAHKYEMNRLNTRLTDLEDLYLQDLAVHKRELNVLKRKMAGQQGEEGGAATPMDGDEERVVGSFENIENMEEKERENRNRG